MALKWTYLAEGEDGLLYSPSEAKQKQQRYHLHLRKDIELTPVVGIFVTPHWRSSSSIDYSTIRPGYEMGNWHYSKQIEAREVFGYELEYRIQIGEKTYYADAYDRVTNTVYEYVDTHFDNFKISAYFANGYNQTWVFREDCPDYRLAQKSDFFSTTPRSPEARELLKRYSETLPSIIIHKDLL
jgi:hypothetical protein